MKKRTFKSVAVISRVLRDFEKVTIGIRNPPVNALSLSVRNELCAAFEDIDGRRGIGEVVLCGTGKYFSAGADLRELQRIAHLKNPAARAAKAFAFARDGQRLVKQILAVRKRITVTAEISGACTGGGLELALACGKRLIKGPFVMGFPETTLGLIPGWGGTVLLPHMLFTGSEEHHFPRESALINYQRAVARDLITNGTLFTHAESWKEYALASPRKKPKVLSSSTTLTVNADEGPKQNVDEFEALEELALPPGRIVSLHTRNLVLEAIPVYEDVACFEDGLLREAELFAKAMTHADAREGIDAFLEKRVARFISMTTTG